MNTATNGKGSARRDDFGKFNRAPYWSARDSRGAAAEKRAGTFCQIIAGRAYVTHSVDVSYDDLGDFLAAAGTVDDSAVMLFGYVVRIKTEVPTVYEVEGIFTKTRTPGLYPKTDWKKFGFAPKFPESVD